MAEALPGARIIKLKLNGEKVVDLASSNVDELIKSQQFLDRYVRFYDGIETQLPDPTLQQVWGINDTPSYRGFLTIMLHDFPLADYGNRPPSVEVYVSEQSWLWQGTVTTLRETPIAGMGTVPPDDFLLGRYTVYNTASGHGVSTTQIPRLGKFLAVCDQAMVGSIGLILPPTQGAIPPHLFVAGVSRTLANPDRLTILPGTTQYTNPDWATGFFLELSVKASTVEYRVNGLLIHTAALTQGTAYQVQASLTAGSVAMQVVTESAPKAITRALPQVVSLRSIVDKLLSGVATNTAELSGRNVRGGLLDQSNRRDRLAELQKTYFFDLIEIDGTLKALSPQQYTLGPLPIADMGASETGDAPPFEIEKNNQTDIPYEVELTYWHESRDDVNAVYARSGKVNPKYNQISLAANLWESEAQAMVNLALRLVQLRSQTIKFATTLDYAVLTPGDVVTLSPYGIDGDYQITEQTLGANLILEQTALPYDAATWDLLPVISNPPQQALIQSVLAEPKIVVFRTTQALRAGDTLPCLYMGVASGGNWSTATFFISINNGQSYYYVGETRSAASIGLLSSTLAAGRPSAIVRMADGSLNQLTADEWTYSRTLNRAVVGTRTTQEIIQFRNATLLSPNTYRLDTFRRGELGSAAIAHPANDWFVLVNAALVTVPLELSTVGATILIKVLLDNEPDSPAIPYLVP